MLTINLKNAQPSDRPHFLLWDTPNQAALQQIAFYNHAQLTNYRDSLMGRIDSQDRFLLLHQHLDRELNAIRAICSASHCPIIILEGLDCLITYLSAHSTSHKNLFWQKLLTMRQLENMLWILLPTKLIPYEVASRKWSVGSRILEVLSAEC